MVQSCNEIKNSPDNTLTMAQRQSGITDNEWDEINNKLKAQKAIV